MEFRDLKRQYTHLKPAIDANMQKKPIFLTDGAECIIIGGKAEQIHCYHGTGF